MKAVAYLGAGLLGILVVGGIALYQLLNVTSVPSADIIGVGTTTPEARLEATPLSTDVHLQVTSESDPILLAEPSPVAVGNTLNTSPTGRVLLSDATGLITTSLDANSSLVITDAETAQGIAFTLALGRLWAQVKRVLEVDESYTVYTPTLVAAVRGTSFGVDLLIIPRIIVAEGVVSVWQRDPVTGIIDEQSNVEVVAGQIVEEIDGTLRVRPLAPADQDEWYWLFNEVSTSTPRDLPVTQAQTPAPEPTREPLPNSGTPVSPVPPAVAPTPTTTQTNPQPSPQEPLRISRVEPKAFTDPAEARLRVYGRGFTGVTEVFTNRRPVEFTVVRDDYLFIDANELGENDDYDLAIVRGREEVVLVEAFTIAIPADEPTPTPTLLISSATQVSDQSGYFLRVVGEGFLAVTEVIVNGQSASEYEIVSNTEIQVYGYASVSQVTLRTSTNEASWPQ